MLTLLEPSPLDPVSLSQVKAHLRLDHAHEDEYLRHLMRVSAQLIQVYLGRSLLKQKWQLIWQKKPTDRPGATVPLEKPTLIELPNPPLVDIHAVNIVTPDGKKPLKRYSLSWRGDVPMMAVGSCYDCVEVIYEAGFGATPADIPAPIVQAILTTVAEFYETRENVSVPANNYIQGLLHPYRVIRLK